MAGKNIVTRWDNTIEVLEANVDLKKSFIDFIAYAEANSSDINEVCNRANNVFEYTFGHAVTSEFIKYIAPRFPEIAVKAARFNRRPCNIEAMLGKVEDMLTSSESTEEVASLAATYGVLLELKKSINGDTTQAESPVTGVLNILSRLSSDINEREKAVEEKENELQ